MTNGYNINMLTRVDIQEHVAIGEVLKICESVIYKENFKT